MPLEGCPYRFVGEQSEVWIDTGWVRNTVPCGREAGHEGPHWPPDPSGGLNYAGNRCSVCGEAWVVGPPVTPGSHHLLSCPYVREGWHGEAAADISKQHSTLHLQRRRKGSPFQSANAKKDQVPKDSLGERQRQRIVELLEEIAGTSRTIAEMMRTQVK